MKPTLYDWYSLAYCCYPKTTEALTVIVKGLGLMLGTAAVYVLLVVVMSLDVLLAP